MKREDFCLPSKILARALEVLILLKLVLFAWGLFAPATLLSVVLILAAITLLAPAYFIKRFLRYGNEEGTFILGSWVTALHFARDHRHHHLFWPSHLSPCPRKLYRYAEMSGIRTASASTGKRVGVGLTRKEEWKLREVEWEWIRKRGVFKVE